MENILDLVIETLRDNDTWFTTKNDPTIQEPSYYYELDKYGELTEEGKNKVIKDVQSYVGDGAICEDDAVEMWFNDNLCEFRLDYTDNLKTKFEPKPVVDQIEAYEVKLQEDKNNSNHFNFKFKGDITIFQSSRVVALKTLQELLDKFRKSSSNILKFEYNIDDGATKTESYKTRLREENSKSREALDKVLNDETFDAESNRGKMVLRAQEVFNKLSDLGYNIEVTIDNGDAELDILLGQQGGKAVITLNSDNQPIKAFASGNFELTKSNLEILNDINEQIQNI